MSIFCEGNNNTKQRRGHIYQIVLNATEATLAKMMEHPLPLGSMESETEAYLRVIMSHQAPISIREMSETLGHWLVSLWNDPYVKRFYEKNVEGTTNLPAT